MTRRVMLDSNGRGVAVKPFTTNQSSVNTGAAAISLKAAVSGKRHWITKAVFVNKTAGEYPVVELTEDHDGTPVKKDTLAPQDMGNSAAMGQVERNYDPPLEITAGKSIGFQLQSETGDVYGHVHGFVEV